MKPKKNRGNRDNIAEIFNTNYIFKIQKHSKSKQITAQWVMKTDHKGKNFMFVWYDYVYMPE